jgi:hypothetical protein
MSLPPPPAPAPPRSLRVPGAWAALALLPAALRLLRGRGR